VRASPFVRSGLGAFLLQSSSQRQPGLASAFSAGAVRDRSPSASAGASPSSPCWPRAPFFITLWVFADDRLCSGRSAAYRVSASADSQDRARPRLPEIFSKPSLGAANSIVWAAGDFARFVRWPFVTVALRQATGSVALAFLCIPAFMTAMALGVWLRVPAHAGKELNAIIM